MTNTRKKQCLNNIAYLRPGTGHHAVFHFPSREGNQTKIYSIVLILLLFILMPPVCVFSAEKKELRHDLFSVTFPTDEKGWVCGRWGTVLHSNDGGKTWEGQESGTDYSLTSVCFVDEKTGWIVGDVGTIIRTIDGGKTWEKQECPVDYLLKSVCFVDNKTGWAVGEYTTILYTADGGKIWKVQFKGEDYRFSSVSFCDHDNGWAVGEYGFTYHTSDGGKTWVHQAGEFGFSEETGEVIGGNYLFDVVAVDPRTAWAVGIDGYVIRTTDGGKSWEKQPENFPKTQLFTITMNTTPEGRNVFAIGGTSTLLLLTSNDQASVNAPRVSPPIEYGWIYAVTAKGENGFAAVGKDGWVYISNNNGESWEKANI
jgi:photosystem II stability/assembly factor-like uncharacterized protein